MDCVGYDMEGVNVEDRKCRECDSVEEPESCTANFFIEPDVITDAALPAGTDVGSATECLPEDPANNQKTIELSTNEFWKRLPPNKYSTCVVHTPLHKAVRCDLPHTHLTTVAQIIALLGESTNIRDYVDFLDPFSSPNVTDEELLQSLETYLARFYASDPYCRNYPVGGRRGVVQC